MRLLLFLLPALLAAATPCSLGPDRDKGQILPGKASVRGVVIGDFGDPENPDVRKGIATHVRSNGAFDFGITVGDNFYPSGVRDERDEHWTEIWEPGYGVLKTPFFAALGNHDYRGNESAQITYTKNYWNMPCNYYTFAAGPVRFYALDTDEGHTGVLDGLISRGLSRAQLDWLKASLAGHTEKWKVVYGHHPAYTVGMHRNQRRVKEMREKVVPLMKAGGAMAYLAGHDHDLQYREVDSIHHAVIGGGGRKNDGRENAGAPEPGVFYKPYYGYMVLTADTSALKFEIVGGETVRDFTSVLTKP